MTGPASPRGRQADRIRRPRTAGSRPQAAATGRANVADAADAHDAHDAPAAPDAPDVAQADWCGRMDALTARLRTLTSRWPSATAAAVMPGSAGRACLADAAQDLLDCALALDQLQSVALQALAGRQQRMSHDLLQLTAALARSRSDGRRASHLALHDGLTALPNRRLFGERLEQALSAGPAPAVLFLDLDGFKAINDHHGHAVGDELLRVVAARLARGMRAGDLVARWGGDEFACLLAGPMAQAPLALLARKLIAAVAQPLQIGALRLSVGASVGIACAPRDGGATAAMLMDHADAAMYRAKRAACGHAFHPA